MLDNPKDSVAVAEKLLQLVKSICNPDVDPFTVWSTKTKIQNACDLLLAKVLGPLEYTALIAESCQESSALHFITSLGIADLIGNNEVALNILSAKSGVDPHYLGVTMSCLMGRGYFEEVGRFGSHIYRNNALSEILRKDGISGLKSGIGFLGDEASRATSRLLDAAKTIALGNTDKSQKNITAANIAFGFSGSIFEWMSRPEEAWRGKRLGMAMQQFDHIFNPNISEEYPWHRLLSPVVDIGGGIGTLEMSILKDERNNHIKFVLFDIPETIDNARMVWSSQPPKLSSQISFVGGNFMASALIDSNIPQGKPTYIIRHALHNWTDGEVVHILSIVHQAMPKNSRLLLVEMLLRPDSSRFVRTMGVLLAALTNGLVRTQEEMEVLVSLAGFKVDKVEHTRAADSVLEVVVA